MTSPSEPAANEGWFFLRSSAIPERWRARAVPVFLVPMAPEEAADLLAGKTPMPPEVSPDEERLATLVARGRTARQIADDLGIAPRSVYRRLRHLRQSFGAASTAELAVRLAERGF